MAVEEKVKSIIAEQLGVKPEEVTPGASFIDDLGADSLDTVELVMALEEEFGIEIPDEDAEKMSTVGDAVKYIEENPDTRLILMDMKLPVMDGYEAARRIKQINPSISVIAQTAFAMADDKQKALDAGCDDYLPKPIDFKELNELLRIYI